MTTRVKRLATMALEPSNLMRDFLAIVGGSLFIALMAQIAIPLPFSPVPLSLQTLGVLLAAGMLGSKKGALAVITYIGEGALGLPFFAGGSAGWMKLLGPTGGYLCGFVVAALVVGYLLDKRGRERLSVRLGVMTLGTFVILLFGGLWLATLLGGSKAFYVGVLPFLLGDLIKIGCAAFLLPSGMKLIRLFQ